ARAARACRARACSAAPLSGRRAREAPMPKRRRERLRPAVRAEPVAGLPEICSPPGCTINFDWPRPDELVFLYTTDGGQHMIRRMRVDGRPTEVDAGGWRALPQASLNGAEWFMCDVETGELVFTLDRKIIWVKPEGGERSVEVEERLLGEGFSIGTVLSRRGRMFCFNFLMSELYLLARDGSIEVGPCRLPQGPWDDESMYLAHVSQTFVVDPAEDEKRWIFFHTRSAIYRWDLRRGQVDCIVGREAEGAVAEGIREGVGPSARLLGMRVSQAYPDVQIPNLQRMCSGLYARPCGGAYYRLDTHSHELLRVDVVDLHGNPLALPWANVLSSPRDAERLTVVIFEDEYCRVKEVFMVDVSVDLSLPTVETDLQGIDWTMPLRHVQFDVGDPPARLVLDARLLTARSLYFARALGSGMLESREETVIRLKHVTLEAMRCFVHYLHTDAFEPEPAAASEGQEETPDRCLARGRLCLEVYQLADQYAVFRLRKLALLRLRSTLGAATALPLLQEAVGDRAWDSSEELPRACWEACSSRAA
ncbi:unnamed protein product, partial [Prorocentrum cordatum]